MTVIKVFLTGISEQI